MYMTLTEDRMTPSEIRMRHKYAANEQEHIRILAQLNRCSQKAIKQILAGSDSFDVDEAPSKTKFSPIDYSNVRNLYDKGLNDREISDMIGAYSKASIHRWRVKEGLPTNVKKGRPVGAVIHE